MHCYSRGTEQGKKGHTTAAEALHSGRRERERSKAYKKKDSIHPKAIRERKSWTGHSLRIRYGL
jgi:hypothetical protein